MPSYAIAALRAKNLCYRCVDEAFLKALIKSDGKRAKCSYCSRVGRSFTLGDMSDRVDAAFQQFYSRTPTDPDETEYYLYRESGWYRDGYKIVDAIADAAQVDPDVAREIQQILEDEYEDGEARSMGEETEYDSDSRYDEKGVNIQAWEREWRAFENSLKTQTRYFSRSAATHLSEIFDGLEAMATCQGQPPIVNAGPGTTLQSLYRARVFQSDARLKEALCRPDLHLGSPPSRLASAGRMNARGISVFYGASKAKAASAEVRPPVGSKVLVARFKITRPLRLLDLRVLSNVTLSGSVFDPDYGARLERSMFLRTLSERITKPVMPDDEAFDYIPTQAVADFLATEREEPLDGIVYPSVQAAGDEFNVVLFHKAARVEELAIPDGAKIDATIDREYGDDETSVPDYSVYEVLPVAAKKEEKDTKPTNWPFIGLGTSTWWDEASEGVRDPALRIVLKTMKVHHIKHVRFSTEPFPVTWTKRQQRDSQDF